MSSPFCLIRRSILLSGFFLIANVAAYAQKVTWVTSTSNINWAVKHYVPIAANGTTNVEVLNQKLQTINGFGGCFNELGWTSINSLSKTDKQSIFKELFAPDYGANFTICRMPVGANDFSRRWYSYDETDGDFGMKSFSIANDEETLVPYIKSALRENPKLKLWASPWSPPQWMKYNKHYAGAMYPKISGVKTFGDMRIDFTNLDNGLKPDQVGHEGSNMFIQDEKYFKAYAEYFADFIKDYRAQHINIGMVMPQNEFNSAQTFPSCTWTAAGLSNFVSYLGPQMDKLGVKIFMGTVERGNPKLVDTVLNNPASGKYIKGVGFQWAGKGAIAEIHQQYPDLTIYESEQECGNGLNDWGYCKYAWSLMKLYFKNGANAYMYWNISLQNGGRGNWGWLQNSMISVDTVNKTYKYNYEYYLMKHLSHFVKPGAKLLNTTGDENVLAFQNPDKSTVIVVYNDSQASKTWHIKASGKIFAPLLAADSFNTFLITK